MAARSTFLAGRSLCRVNGALVKQFFFNDLDPGWPIQPGPHRVAYERAIALLTGATEARALNSYQAAVLSALHAVGVIAGDAVVMPTVAPAKLANILALAGIRIVFVDSEPLTWGLDPDLLREALLAEPRIKAVFALDLYGQCPDYSAIEELCARRQIPLIEDVCCALGASFRRVYAGAFGTLAILPDGHDEQRPSWHPSWRGGASGGAVLLTARKDSPTYRDVECELVALAPQPISESAALAGRAQIHALASRIRARRLNDQHYREQLDLSGIQFMRRDPRGHSTSWVTCITLDERRFGVDTDVVRQQLARRGLEVRSVYQPLHSMVKFASVCRYGGEFGEQIYRTSICLPAGTAVDESLRQRYIAAIRECHKPALSRPCLQQERPWLRTDQPPTP